MQGLFWKLCETCTNNCSRQANKKGLKIQGRAVKRQLVVSNEFWSTSSGEFDRSTLQSQTSALSINTAYQRHIYKTQSLGYFHKSIKNCRSYPLETDKAPVARKWKRTDSTKYSRTHTLRHQQAIFSTCSSPGNDRVFSPHMGARRNV